MLFKIRKLSTTTLHQTFVWVTKGQSRRLRHNFAIARDLPDSFVDALSSISHNTNNDVAIVDLDVARRQHETYVATLRQHVPTLCLPALPNHPDCLFVEDTVVAIGKQAVVTHPGHVSRQGEVDSIHNVLIQLGLTVTDMRQQERRHEEAFCDGGDVLYNGRHLFVGQSQRTNRAAAEVLKTVFSNVVEQVVTVPVPSAVLHLKSAVTHLDESTMILPVGSVGDELESIFRQYGYTRFIRVPDPLACNVLVINGHVLAQATECVESRRVLQQAATERSMGLTWVDTSELAKKDAALTCGSVLLQL